MQDIRILLFLLTFCLSTTTVIAKDCTEILLQARELTEKNQWQACINLLQHTSCPDYEYVNLLTNAYIKTENYAKVRQLTESTLRKQTTPSIKALAHYYNALALYKLKQYPEAYTHIQQSLDSWSNTNTAEYAMSLNTKGAIYEAQGKYTEAIDTYEQALTIYESLHEENMLPKWQISTLTNMANAYINKNSDMAIKYLQKAMNIYQQYPHNTYTEYVTLLNNMGAYFNQQGDYNAATIYYQQAANVKKEHADTKSQSYALLLLNVITTLYNAEQYEESIPYIEEYLHILRQMLQRNFTVMSQKEREAYWDAQAQILDNLLVSATYAALNNKNADASLLYDICLLSKSLLLDTSIHIENLIHASTNRQLKHLRDQLIEAQQKLLLLDNYGTEYAEKLNKQCDSLQHLLLQGMTLLQSQMKQLHITWRDIQKQLTKNDVAVEFICLGTGKDTEYSVIILRHDWKFPKVYYLNGLAETLSAQQITPIEMHDNAIFGKLVWQAVLKHAKVDDHIYFVPAGQLQLMSAEYFSINSDVKMYDRYHMHRLSSTKQLLRPQQNTAISSVALVGGMDYNAKIDEIAFYMDEYKHDPASDTSYTQLPPTNQIWQPLPGALREVQQINDLLTSRHIKTFIATHDAATDGALYAIAREHYDIIHISTHGFYGNNSQQVGLVMAGANTLRLHPNTHYGTGILNAEQLAKLSLRNTQLAVLSACQTGIGKVTTEGVFGLQRAFKRAGVHSLLVSLWEVNDAVTATLMTTFYKAILAGYQYNEAYIIAIDSIRKTTFNINGVPTTGDDISLYGAFVLID